MSTFKLDVQQYEVWAGSVLLFKGPEPTASRYVAAATAVYGSKVVKRPAAPKSR